MAATVEEARTVMVEGPSGILACARTGEIREWSPARRTITFASGAQAFLYSGASPEGLRGPEHDFAWCDELAKWRHPQSSWDNLSFGLRRGSWPRALITTTPRAGTVLGAILDLPDTVRTGGSTRANVYLPDAYVSGVEARYAAGRAGARRGVAGGRGGEFVAGGVD
ncbi:terminase large subunit domain-containing protein [Sphingomonas sp. SUN039]|uniref:terminase large subunit domain-containing protein n=1 Tax=Sphingomonas sp. SUN039 TaxID=2937787 RepID=UPI0028685D27|nr:terminase family protein [Sphingomonas sp. SUN039]